MSKGGGIISLAHIKIFCNNYSMIHNYEYRMEVSSPIFCGPATPVVYFGCFAAIRKTQHFVTMNMFSGQICVVIGVL